MNLWHSLFIPRALSFFKLFIFGCAGFSLLCVGFSPDVVSEGYSLVAVCGLPGGVSCCGA